MLLVGIAGLALAPAHWALALLAIVLASFALSSLGMLIAVSVREVFEAMTLFNFFRFPMVFLCGVFIPVSAMCLPLRIVAYGLPLTYAIDGLRQAVLPGPGLLALWADLGILAAYAGGLFLLAEQMLARQIRKEY